MRLTEEQYAALMAKRRPLADQATLATAPSKPAGGKYRNHRTTVDGIEFDSKAEASRWLELKTMERAGLISDLARQVPFELTSTMRAPSGKIVRPITYVADFVYTEKGAKVVEDVKGMKTAEYRIKAKLMMFVHCIEIREVQA